VAWPSVVIACAILSFHILGDALRDVLAARIRGR
jgi:ABC-type dipeptide/oligopeptide/nickel transport system permease subunit